MTVHETFLVYGIPLTWQNVFEMIRHGCLDQEEFNDWYPAETPTEKRCYYCRAKKNIPCKPKCFTKTVEKIYEEPLWDTIQHIYFRNFDELKQYFCKDVCKVIDSFFLDVEKFEDDFCDQLVDWKWHLYERVIVGDLTIVHVPHDAMEKSKDDEETGREPIPAELLLGYKQDLFPGKLAMLSPEKQQEIANSIKLIFPNVKPAFYVVTDDCACCS